MNIPTNFQNKHVALFTQLDEELEALSHDLETHGEFLKPITLKLLESEFEKKSEQYNRLAENGWYTEKQYTTYKSIRQRMYMETCQNLDLINPVTPGLILLNNFMNEEALTEKQRERLRKRYTYKQRDL